MSAIGSLVFCTDCGNLLDSSTGDANTLLTCACCGTENRDTSSQTVLTKTKASSFPSVLRQKRSAVQTVEMSDRDNEATAMVDCPECGRKEVKYQSLQLRGADEGSTNFYTCECGYKWKENN
ncbi:hypothetical protein VE00_06180 [Pseudogymnoascus sp. WSF 3629]|nr:hypothetical protein VE00_06180 [Pseudogymnoascus sp. WSF 3629]